MNDVAHELAMIVCKQCSKEENESELDFSTRLYKIYVKSFDNIYDLRSEHLEPRVL